MKLVKTESDNDIVIWPICTYKYDHSMKFMKEEIFYSIVGNWC